LPIAADAVGSVDLPGGEWIIYGSQLGGDLTGDIYAIDMNSMTATLVFDVPNVLSSSPNYPNGNAYDPVNQRVYFSVPGSLYFYEIGAGDYTYAGAVSGTVACGAWYIGKYYYVSQETDDLYEVTFDSGGTIATGGNTKICDYSDDTKTFTFGDIVFDVDTPGLLLGSANADQGNYEYFAIDLTTTPCTYRMVQSIAHHKQLAFGSGGTLYGLDAPVGEYYIIDQATGNETPIGTVSSDAPGYQGGKFTDLASGPLFMDCNSNGIPDADDIAGGTSEDCQPNDVPDECDLADGTSEDCNTNDVPDECDISEGTSDDCNANGIPDDCEADGDGDGVIDACDGCPDDPNKTDPGICGCNLDDDADSDGDSVADCIDQCPGVNDGIFAPSCVDAIPTVSAWGLAILTMLLLAGAKIHFGRRRRA
jgi:hypothetical protein